MEERDERLRKLIATLRQQSKGSLSWRKALNGLLLEIQQLPGLAKSNHPDYLQALDDTLMRVGEEIEEFEPQQASITSSLVAWINLKLRLKYQVRDLYAGTGDRARTRTTNKSIRQEFKEQARKPPLSLDVPLDAITQETFAAQLPDETPSTIWEQYEEIAREQEKRRHTRIGIQLQAYIEADPDNILASCHPRAHPQCNCQVLAWRLLLKYPPDKLVDIAKDLNINYHTLNWHWKNKGLPLLQNIAKNFGYQPERDM
ncbi:MAG: hypothetical protein SAL07_02655 [Oscillatoria sp. PMC 1051.18]|nr:hypothetical protein [Oscillatoria sp. PMC 1050.18]MEC5028788.1 hypothetical protein [Oscillatoria sp. PMC 1051.18]